MKWVNDVMSSVFVFVSVEDSVSKIIMKKMPIVSLYLILNLTSEYDICMAFVLSFPVR